MSKPRKKKRSPKRVLALPDLEQSKATVLNSLSSESGQRTYDHAITEYVDWYCSEPRLAFNRTVVYGTGSISSSSTRPRPSTCDWRRSAELLLRLRTPACSVRNCPPGFDE